MTEHKKDTHHYNGFIIIWQLDKWMVSHHTHTICLGFFNSLDAAKKYVDIYRENGKSKPAMGMEEFTVPDEELTL